MPPMGWMNRNEVLGRTVSPSISDPATRECKRMNPTVLDHGELEIVTSRRASQVRKSGLVDQPGTVDPISRCI
jgi:hypothetical protein